MRFKILIILLLVDNAVPFCYGQSADKQNFKQIVKTIYISEYDSNPPPLNFRRFDLNDDLPRGGIQDLVQTSDGFVWLSLYGVGLVRFDGYHYRVFKPVEGDTTSFPDEQTSYIVKSHKKGLWIVSTSGIIWFDLVTYKTRLIRLPSKLSSDSWTNLIEDEQQRLWIFGRKNLFLYEPKNNIFTEITNRLATDAFSRKKINIEDAQFKKLKETGNGELFIAGNYLLKLNTKSFEFIFYKRATDYIADFLIDDDSENIWLCDYNDLIKYNYNVNEQVKYHFNKTGEENSFGLFFISKKSRTELWLSNPYGIRVFDKRNDHIRFYTKHNSSNVAGTFNHSEGINGVQWFYNYLDGITAFIPTVNRFNYRKILPSSQVVSSQWHDEKNNIIWFGTYDQNYKGGLYKYNIRGDQFTKINVPFKQDSYLRFIIPVLDNYCIVAIEGFLAPLWGRLFLLNTATNKLIPIHKLISNSKTLTTDSFYYKEACLDKSGNYWFATNRGLLNYNINTQNFFQYSSNPKDTATLSDDDLFGVVWGKNNTIWTCSQDYVLNELDAITGKVKHIRLFLKDGYGWITPLYEDKKGNIWIGTSTGLLCYNRYSNEKIKVPKILTYPSWVYEDSNGNIIALAMDGVWFYDPIKKIARCFDERDGIILEYHEQWYTYKNIHLFRDSLFINDSYGFSLSDLYPQKEVSPLNLTALKIFGKELSSTKNVNVLDTLILSHNDNQLTFEFAIANFLTTGRNTYACKLQGSDSGWQNLGAVNSITYANLAPGSYTFKVKASNPDGIWGEERILHIEIVPAFWQTKWFKISVILIVILIVAGFFYWLYQNRSYQLNLKYDLENEKLQQQKKEAEFEKRIADLSLSALRSQINPHFIFNCLNSIKLYASQNDINAASDYLTKFSRLIRMVLENSKNERVTFSSELEVLRLYIEMEAMRFKEKLKYNITVEKNVEADYIEVPPLLLQPYVENAIWHGLMHKEHGGNIDIRAVTKDDSLLIITVKDDGIGRAKAAELKSKTATNHKSFGMKITSERMELINLKYKTVNSVTIDDLKDERGEPAGTLVTLKIQIE